MKENRFRDMGHIILKKCYCDFQTQLRQNNGIADYVHSSDIQCLINLRDCYFGGRTYSLISLKQFTNAEKGYYVDITSLNPDIPKYDRFLWVTLREGFIMCRYL